MRCRRARGGASWRSRGVGGTVSTAQRARVRPGGSRCIVTTSSAGQPERRDGTRPSVDDLFRDTQPVHSGDDLARQGVFAEGEVEEFIADLRAMRHADLS
jgi:hypothetical protein